MSSDFRTLSRVYTDSHTHVQERMKAFSMTPDAILFDKKVKIKKTFRSA